MKVYDSAEFLSTPEAVQAYLDEALQTGDPAFIAHALGAVTRARSMTEIARKTGLSRESLYRSLSADGRPELATVMKVVGALGLTLSTRVAPPAASKRGGSKAPRKVAGKAAGAKGRKAGGRSANAA